MFLRLWTLQRRLLALTGLGVDPERIRLIVNRWHKGDEEPLKSIEKETKRPVFACLPNDFRKASAAMNLGMPLMENHNNVLTDRYRQLAEQLAGGACAARLPKRGGLEQLFSLSRGRNKRECLQLPFPGRTDFSAVKTAIHRRLIQKLNLDRLNEIRREDVRREVSQILEALVVGESTPMNLQERERLAQEVLDEVFGLGPLEPLLNDPTVSDILVNTYRHVYVERNGILESTSVQFRDDAHLMSIIDRIVSAIGRRVDESSPMVDARLADGSRVNAIIPPLCRRWALPFDPAIRPRSADGGRSDRAINTLTPAMLELLQGCVKARLNVLISGGTGAGKTTFLNVLSSYISNRERIVTIEDAAELQLHQEHVVRLETRPPNIEGKGAVQQRQLLINYSPHAPRPDHRR